MTLLLIFRTFRTLGHTIVNFGCFGPPVAVVESRDSLREYFPNEVFSNVVLGLAAPSDQLLEVSSVAVLHDDEDLSLLFVDYSVVVPHDVVVV